ncbi:MAG: hypothetical protein BRC28_03140 [Nanohaloarchaea archaeon SW_4_43_9]|nr:MAG: hypothetical protein BRC28_03140 [Nanohaloarchaea archaeon SW_4_43_9]
MFVAVNLIKIKKHVLQINQVYRDIRERLKRISASSAIALTILTIFTFAFDSGYPGSINRLAGFIGITETTLLSATYLLSVLVILLIDNNFRKDSEKPDYYTEKELRLTYVFLNPILAGWFFITTAFALNNVLLSVGGFALILYSGFKLSQDEFRKLGRIAFCILSAVSLFIAFYAVLLGLAIMT